MSIITLNAPANADRVQMGNLFVRVADDGTIRVSSIIAAKLVADKLATGDVSPVADAIAAADIGDLTAFAMAYQSERRPIVTRYTAAVIGVDAMRKVCMALIA